MKTRAVILDLDGLLVDSEPLHQRAFNTLLSRHGISYQFKEDEYGEIFVGVPVKENADYVVRRFQMNMTPAELLAEREAIFERLISDPANLAPMPGVLAALDELEERGIVLGLASGSPRVQVDLMLNGLALSSRFRVIVAGTDVLRTKPAPDVYLRAVEELRIQNSACVAIEDSATGVQAAKAAGLFVIAVPNQYTRVQKLDADACAANLTSAIALLDRG